MTGYAEREGQAPKRCEQKSAPSPPQTLPPTCLRLKLPTPSARTLPSSTSASMAPHVAPSVTWEGGREEYDR